MLHYLILFLILINWCTGDGKTPGSYSPPPPPSPSEDHSQQTGMPPPDPEVVKAKLSALVDEQLDRNKDSYVTVDELRDWLQSTHLNAIQTNLDSQWNYYGPELRQVTASQSESPKEVEVISWETYKNLTYPESLMESESAEEVAAIKETLKRLERRWKKADINGDQLLTKEEFKIFLHPEESEATSDVVVEEAFEDVDKDENKEVSLQEYMEYSMNIGGEETNDVNWKQAQQGHFTNYLDKNKDGSLNKDEFKDWILPPYDRHEAEAWRLISLADMDRDTKITKEDILRNHQYFMALHPPEFWFDERQYKHDEF